MKAAIVGCGNIAAVHAKSISLLEGVELAAAADIRRDRAEKYEREYGCHAYDSLESMLEAERPDVLHICTPHYLHVPMAQYALQSPMKSGMSWLEMSRDKICCMRNKDQLTTNRTPRKMRECFRGKGCVMGMI